MFKVIELDQVLKVIELDRVITQQPVTVIVLLFDSRRNLHK